MRRDAKGSEGCKEEGIKGVGLGGTKGGEQRGQVGNKGVRLDYQRMKPDPFGSAHMSLQKMEADIQAGSRTTQAKQLEIYKTELSHFKK
jgi:hypothetical protein